MQISGVKELDVQIDVNDAEAGAKEVLQTIRPGWSEADIVFKFYTAGITNILLGCRLKTDTEYDDAVLMRIYGAKTDLIIDRELEMLAMVILNKANCCKPLLCKFANGISYSFLPGTCLDPNTVRDDHIGKLVAQEMARVGAIDPEQYSGEISLDTIRRKLPKEAVLFTKMRKYLANGPDSFPDPEKNARFKDTIKSKDELNQEIDMLERELSALGSPVVFTHNDILLNNIVFNEKEDRCYFIDYEYAAFSYQAFDIGNHFCEWAGVDEVDYSLYPGREEQLVWLRHFLEADHVHRGQPGAHISETDLHRLYVQVNKFALAAHFFWGVWALIQARYSTIDFDFLQYAKIRFDEYFTRKDAFLALKMPA